MEMKSLVTHVIQNFETIRFAAGEDGSDLVLNTKDHFTVGVKPMKMIFEAKKR